MNTDVFGDFKGIVDRNAMLKHAYKGYDLTPDYTCSANMITFPEVQADIFQLNKYGIANDVEVDFHIHANIATVKVIKHIRGTNDHKHS